MPRPEFEGPEFEVSLDTSPMRGVERVSDAGRVAWWTGLVLVLVGALMGLTVALVEDPQVRPLLGLAGVQVAGGVLIAVLALRQIFAGRIITIWPDHVAVRGVRANTAWDFDEPLENYDRVVLRHEGPAYVIELRHVSDPSRTVPLLRTLTLSRGDCWKAAERYAQALDVGLSLESFTSTFDA